MFFSASMRWKLPFLLPVSGIFVSKWQKCMKLYLIFFQKNKHKWVVIPKTTFFIHNICIQNWSVFYILLVQLSLVHFSDMIIFSAVILTCEMWIQMSDFKVPLALTGQSNNYSAIWSAIIKSRYFVCPLSIEIPDSTYVIYYSISLKIRVGIYQ